MLLITLFYGCTFGGVKVTKEIEENETENEIIFIETPKIKGMGEEFSNTINQQIEESIKAKKENFLDRAKATKEERDKKAKLEISQKVTYNKNDLLSIVSECFEYTSGLTGAVSRMVVNIDTKSEKRIYLKDLFNDEEYIEFLNAKLLKMSEKEEYSDIWEKPVIEEAQNEYFYLADDGLVIFYPPYELSYYARGFVEFCIPYSELYGYLKPEYTVLY